MLQGRSLRTTWSVVVILTSEPDTVSFDEFDFFFNFTLQVHIRTHGDRSNVAKIDAALADMASVGRAAAARIGTLLSSITSWATPSSHQADKAFSR